MSDDYSFEARRARGGAAPPFISNLLQLIQGFAGNRQFSGSSEAGPAYPGAQPVPQSPDPYTPPPSPVPQSGNNFAVPDAQAATPAPAPAETPQDQPPEAQQDQPKETPREPDQAQPDPTTQPIIQPAPPDPTTQPIIDPLTERLKQVPAPPFKAPQAPSAPDITQPFQLYVPQPKRHYDWGKASWVEDALDSNPEIMRTSLAPSQRESYPHIRDAGKRLAAMAPPGISAPAKAASDIAGILSPFMDYLSGGAFSPAFGKAQAHALANMKARWQMQKEYYEMQREHMLDMNDEAVRRHREHIDGAREIYAQYEHHQFDKAPGGPEAELERRLREWGAGDQNFLNSLNNGGVKTAQSWLDEMDKEADRMALSGRSLRASDRRRREAAGTKPSGYTGDDLFEGGGGGEGGDPAIDPATGKRIVRDKPREDAAEPSPSKRDAAEPPAEPATDPDQVDDEIRNKFRDRRGRPMTEEAVRVAREWAEKGTPEGLTPNQYRQKFDKKSSEALENYNKVATAMQLYKRRMADAVKQRSEDESSEDRIRRLEAVSPDVAEKVKGLGMYALDPKAKENLGLTNLVKQVYPSWDHNNFQAAKAFTDPKSPRYQLSEKLGSLGAGDAQLVSLMKDKSEDVMVPSIIIDQWLTGNWRGDPEWGAIGGVLQELNIATVSATTMTGARPAVTLINTLNRKTEQGVSLRAIRAAVQAEQGVVFTHFAGPQRAWEALNRDTLMPGMDQTNFKLLSDFLRMDPNTQRMPEDAHIQMSRSSKPESLWYSDLTPAQKTRPVLSSQEMRDAEDYVRANRRDPNPEVQARVKKYMDLIGPVANGPWNWPQYDREIDPRGGGKR